MIFKRIKQYPDFLVSDTGVVKADPTITIRSNGRILKKKERIIKQHIHPKGYVYVGLCRNGLRATLKVHTLVALTFLENPNNYKEVNHKNGTKNDNRIENLEWCTRSENMKHAFSFGLRSSRGENNSNSKLTSNQVLEIREKKFKGEKTSTLAASYDVSLNSIRNIINGVTWT